MQNQTAVRFGVSVLAFLVFLSAAGADPAGARGKKRAVSWETLVRRGNTYRERNRANDAMRTYQQALKVLEKQGVDDIRKAIVLNDIADVYRSEDNRYAARMEEVLSSQIYQKEIENHKLGYEYASKKSIDYNSGALRPFCYLCHENWKVVPILYGKDNGYDGEVPSDDDDKFTHKPGGLVIGDPRWYCRDCHQSF